MFVSISRPKGPSNPELPYTAKLPCLLRGSFHRFRRCDPSFYAVGKIHKNGWRKAFGIAMPNTWEEYLATRPVPTSFRFHYTGPFFIRCDHGCTHGNNTHATSSVCTAASSIDRRNEFRPDPVFRRSERQIKQAGLVFVWNGAGSDSLGTAYGSMVEIGIAHALNKPILFAHHPRAKVRDFWFAIETAAAVVCTETPLAALQMLWADRSSR